MTIFCTFTPLISWKIKILKKWKKAWRHYHFTHVYHKWQSYDVWFLRYRVKWTELFVILDHFLLFYPPQKTQKIKILKKWRKMPGDIIICKCPINDNHMMYGSWHMKCEGQFFFFFFVILDHFLRLYHTNNLNFEKV